MSIAAIDGKVVRALQKVASGCPDIAVENCGAFPTGEAGCGFGTAVLQVPAFTVSLTSNPPPCDVAGCSIDVAGGSFLYQWGSGPSAGALLPVGADCGTRHNIAVTSDDCDIGAGSPPCRAQTPNNVIRLVVPVNQPPLPNDDCDIPLACGRWIMNLTVTLVPDPVQNGCWATMVLSYAKCFLVAADACPLGTYRLTGIGSATPGAFTFSASSAADTLELR